MPFPFLLVPRPGSWPLPFPMAVLSSMPLNLSEVCDRDHNKFVQLACGRALHSLRTCDEWDSAAGTADLRRPYSRSGKILSRGQKLQNPANSIKAFQI